MSKTVLKFRLGKTIIDSIAQSISQYGTSKCVISIATEVFEFVIDLIFPYIYSFL